MRPPKATVAIISPALRKANNGNWQTAQRWSHFLREDYDVTLAAEWSVPVTGTLPACLIALHARRSAESIAKFAEACPDRPLVVVLTGTDLYRDIRIDAAAQRSLDLATHLVVLQSEGLAELSDAQRAKCRVIYQSAAACAPEPTASQDHFDVVLVGHMRAEKDPATPMQALLLLPDDSRVRLIHIGGALDAAYERAALALEARAWPGVRRYLWLRNLPHPETRKQIRQARAMVISSVMEGGANVIIEAITSGVPVLASRIPGNVGMLGRDYEGYFPPGDAAQLAQMLERISRDATCLDRLRQQCALRAPLFAPAREREEVGKLVADAIQTT